MSAAQLVSGAITVPQDPAVNRCCECGTSGTCPNSEDVTGEPFCETVPAGPENFGFISFWFPGIPRVR